MARAAPSARPGRRPPHPPPRRSGRCPRGTGAGLGARPARLPARPALGGGGTLEPAVRVGGPVAVGRAVVVAVPPAGGPPPGEHRDRPPPAPGRRRPLVGRGPLRLADRRWPTPSSTPTPISPSSTGPATPRSSLRRRLGSASPPWPSPTTTASTEWSASPRRLGPSACQPSSV